MPRLRRRGMIANNSVVGLVVRISAFQADGPGSIPGQRISTFSLRRMVRVSIV